MKRKFFCYALNDFCGRDTFCNECEVYDGTGGECRDTELTNADRIRSMTDEELAAVISQKEGLVQFCGNKVECLEMLCADAEIPDEWCMECAMEWLKQPCEEGKHENS